VGAVAVLWLVEQEQQGKEMQVAMVLEVLLHIILVLVAVVRVELERRETIRTVVLAELV
jgi:hypothetical protein